MNQSFTAWILLALSLGLAGGCDVRNRCSDPGEIGNSEGECRPLPGMDAGPQDAGPLQSCTSDADCTDSGRPRCDLGLIDGTCVECLPADEATDCPDAVAPRCIQVGTEPAFCGCQTDADCVSASGRPVCSDISNTCVECATDTEAENCTDPLAPRCITTLERCGCASDGQCPTETPSPSFTAYTCDMPSMPGRCIECGSDTDCTDPARPVCDSTTFTCAGCTGNPQCERFAGRGVCNTDNGVCSECLLGDESACGGAQTCDLITGECSDVPPASVNECGACTNDVQCADARLCVPMVFGEGEEALDAGAYCLSTTVSLGSSFANNPYTSQIPARASVNGENDGMGYCGPNETQATCPAVEALINSDVCADGMMCPVGGRCETVMGRPNGCTYSCMTSSECPSPLTCGTGYCGST